MSVTSTLSNSPSSLSIASTASSTSTASAASTASSGSTGLQAPGVTSVHHAFGHSKRSSIDVSSHLNALRAAKKKVEETAALLAQEQKLLAATTHMLERVNAEKANRNNQKSKEGLQQQILGSTKKTQILQKQLQQDEAKVEELTLELGASAADLSTSSSSSSISSIGPATPNSPAHDAK